MKNLNKVVRKAIINRLKGGLAIDKYIGRHTEDKRQKAKLMDEYRMFMNDMCCGDGCCGLSLPKEMKGEYDITIISETPYPEVPSVGPVANILGIDKELVVYTRDNEYVVIEDVEPQVVLKKAYETLGEFGILDFRMDEENKNATLTLAYA